MRTIPNRTIYRCDHCPKHYLSKGAAERHEQFCRRNPNNKHRCFGCEHLVATQEATGVDKDGNLRTAGKRFACAKFGRDMYSYVAERRELTQRMPADVVRMPLECTGFEPESFPELNPLPLDGGPDDLQELPF